MYTTENTRQGRLERFFQTAFERQAIYAMKEAGAPKPWTKDSQFNTWYFCNVFRTQDKVTKWIKEHVIDRYKDDPDLWKKIIVARRLSRIESMEAVEQVNGYENLDAGREQLFKMVNLGLPIFTNAFVQGIPDPSLGRDKISYIYNLIKFYEDQGILPGCAQDTSIQECTEQLMLAPNMGGFLSYEVATDFTYCDQYLADAVDMYTWANPGPGAIRGLNRIEIGVPEERLVAKYNALQHMREIHKKWVIYVKEHKEEWKEEVRRRLGAEPSLFDTSSHMDAFDNITMREVEHWLCEFDKHERIGRNKRTYPL